MRNPSSRNATSSRSTPTPCCGKVGIKRGPWTPEEDEILANYIKKDGEGRWRTLPKRAGLLRCGKSCRLRWMNYLRPSVKRGRIAPDEEDLILRLHRLLGNRWSLIAGRIPGRTDNEIKNYWNTHLSKKLISQGIDPKTHKPLYPNPNSSEISNIAPIQNSNPSSFPLEENARFDRAITMTNLDQFPNQVIDDGAENRPSGDGFNKGGLLQSHHEQNEEHYTGYENEDTFSSFLDSLINENIFMYQEQQQLQQPNIPVPSGEPVISSSQAIHHGSICEEVTYSMAAFGEKDGVLNSHDLA